MQIRLRLAPLTLAALLAQPALAQETPTGVAPDTADRDIIVSAARSVLPASALPLTIDIIDEEEFVRQLIISGSTVDAVSALLPSFSPTRDKLSGAGESLRGRSPLFAINGIPQSTPIRDGSRDGYTIDPFFIDRVEVIYGSNALQGIGATGGVINQVTVRPPDADGFSARTLLQGTIADSFADEAAGGKIAGLANWRSGAFDASVGATFERRGVFIDGAGNRIGVDGTQGEIQDSDSWSVFGRFGYELAPDTIFEVVANHFELEGNAHYILVPGDRDAGLPATSERGTTPGDPPSNEADLLSASLTDRNLLGGAFTLQGFYSKTQDVFGGGTHGTFQDPVIAPRGTLFDQSANVSEKLGGKVSYERAVPGFEDLIVTLGFDALFDTTEQSLVQTGRTWVPETEFRSLAPFAQGNLALLDGLFRVSGGVRYEDVQLKVNDFRTLASYGGVLVGGGTPSFDRALWNAGVIVEPLPGVRAYGSYAEGFTIADVGRILRGIDEPGVDVDTYLALEPIVSDNRELGVEFDRGVVRGGVSYFWSDSDLGQRLVPNPDGIFEVRREPIGIEGLEANLSVLTPIRGLVLSAGYSHLTGAVDTDEDGDLDTDLDGGNISPNRLNVAADYERGRFNSRLQLRHFFEREFEGLPATYGNFEGYTLLDAYAGYLTNFGLVALGVQNLLDETYVTYHSQTVRVQDDSRFFAGRGRTFTLSLRSEF